MTVRELIELLEEFDGNIPVVTKASNSCYCDTAMRAKLTGVSSFYGSDYKAVVIMSGGQAGNMCDIDEIEEA